jgi:hypothetical protein
MIFNGSLLYCSDENSDGQCLAMANFISTTMSHFTTTVSNHVIISIIQGI